MKFLAAVGIVITVDQLVKYFVVRDSLVTYGQGWLFGKGLLPDLISVWLALLVIVLLILIWKSGGFGHDSSNQVLVALVIGGGLSNLIDRVRFGFVVDYLKVGSWPVFNLADVFLTLGVFGLIRQILKVKN
jgi:signal peptidase II